MKFTGKVALKDGTPLAKANADMVTIERGKLVVVGTGRVSKGNLTLEAEAYPLWGLRLDELAVLALVRSAKTDSAVFSEIIRLDEPEQVDVFHALDGLIYGLPKALLHTAAPRVAATPSAAREALPGVSEAPGTPLSFGTLLSSTAKQLKGSVASEAGFSLKSANVMLKGVPTAMEGAIGMVFPTPAELAASSIGLSALSFELNPKEPTSANPGPRPGGPVVPDLLGYTRELSLRKLTALGFLHQVNVEVVQDPTQHGRVIRQLPKANVIHPEGAVVTLFVGKQQGI